MGAAVIRWEGQHEALAEKRTDDQLPVVDGQAKQGDVDVPVEQRLFQTRGDVLDQHHVDVRMAVTEIAEGCDSIADIVRGRTGQELS